MSALQRIAELAKLARLLGSTPEALADLAPLDAGALRQLRERLAAAMSARARPRFARIAAASRLLPNKLTAFMAEKVFGPMLCARVVGLLAPEHALDVALRTADAFLADAATELDPRTAQALIRGFPLERMHRVAALLVQRRDYVTLGRFVDCLAPEAVSQVMNRIDDDEALLRSAFYVESKTVLNDLLGFLPAERIQRLAVLAGTGGHDLWAEALSLTTHMDARWRGRIGDLVAAEGEALLAGMVQSAQRLELWDAVLPVVACMSLASRKRLAQLPALGDAAVLRSIVEVAAPSDELWAAFLPLIEHMPPATRDIAADVLGALPEDLLLRGLEGVQAQGLWPALVRIAEALAPEVRAQWAGLLARMDEASLKRLLAVAQDQGLGAHLAPLAALAGPELRQRLVRLAPWLETAQENR